MRKLTIAHLNANGLPQRRLFEIRTMISVFKIDVLCLNETWLKSNDCLAFPGFTIYRYDRVGAQKGGVAVLVKADLVSNNLGTGTFDKCEVQLVSIDLEKGEPLVVAAIYCPPEVPLSEGAISFVGNHQHLLLLGDFNAKNEELGTTGRPNASGKRMVEVLTKLNLNLLNGGMHTYTTPSGRKECLDLVIASKSVAKMTTEVVGLPDVGSDHLPVAITLNGIASRSHSYPELRWNLEKARWELFRQLVEAEVERVDEEFDELVTPDQIDWAAETLTWILEHGQIDAVPKVRAGEFRPWKLNATIYEAILERRRCRRAHEHLQTEESKLEYNRAVKIVKDLVGKAVSERFRSRLDIMNNIIATKPRLFWKEFNALTNSSNASSSRSYPPISEPGQPTAFTDQAKADSFAKYLTEKIWITPEDPKFCAGTADLVNRTIAKHQAELEPALEPRQLRGRWRFEVPDVLAVVKHLKLTAPGHDGVLNAILKQAPLPFWILATKLFNASLAIGYVPKAWKSAVVTLIPKEGKDWQKHSGYRPISLLPCLGKVMERLVARRLMGEMIARKIMPKSQSAFQSQHSVEDHTFRLVQLAATGMCDKLVTILVCLDVQGAFDRVWHDGLRYKLLNFGIPTVATAWISDFLRNRSFQCRVGQCHSELKPISGGVPQGSPLSPILFNLFTADLPRDIGPGFHGLFADDLALANQADNEKDATDRINKRLVKVNEWYNRWRLNINAAKSQAMRISGKQGAPTTEVALDGVVIKWHKFVKYLGVWLDERLLFKKHLTEAVAKANRRTAALRGLCRRRGGLSTKAGLTVYKAYIMPVLLFACPVWLGITQAQWDLLETRQSIALRLALHLPPWWNAIKARRSAAMPTIQERATSLAIDWLTRCLNYQNLVGKEAEASLETAANDERTYWFGRRPPLNAIVKAYSMTNDQPI